jgi:hypothetical protein
MPTASPEAALQLLDVESAPIRSGSGRNHKFAAGSRKRSKTPISGTTPCTELPLSAIARAFEQAIEHQASAIQDVQAADESLSWEEREAAGIAELLRIHQDALMRPLSDAEYARSQQIVATLNAHHPAMN